MHLTTRLLMSIALAATSVASGASDAPPDALHRVQAYDGPARPRSEVAILFAMDGRPRNESATFCTIDGLSLERDGECASVIYVLPGPHRLTMRYRSTQQFGTGKLLVNTAANRLYQVNFSSLRVGYAGALSVIPMYDGAKLSWRNLAPGLAVGRPWIDEEVPYEPNSAHAGPVQKQVVSDADRPTVDVLLACAGKFAIEVELRKFDHQEYDSRYAAVGAFVQATLPYMAEEDALAGKALAQREAMKAYAPAFVPLEAATENSKNARAKLKADMETCVDFYRTHRSGVSAKPEAKVP